ncbi:hypothetical protein EKO04_009912 [Ascochyta lentis]|uniref:Uncharacterized protein n=1 Tax=Ascochyta lentis TaxID=205686 RepID=A0A8H7IYZ2_9PLEO|nr:hypothetical protein EKO04_009912 [Ascochyta lentis]
MARKICNHPVFPGLRAKLTALKITVCPTCLIRFHIFEIAETQAALERRGGIFASRAAADNDAPGRAQERVCHRALVRRWRVAKIDLYRDLYQLYALRAEGAGKIRWELQLSKAFDLWSEVEIECSRMPGYKYSENGLSDVVDGDGPDVESDKFDYRLNEETLDQATPQDDQGWKTVKSRSRFSRQPSGDEAVPSSSPTMDSEDTNMSENTDCGGALDMQDPDEVALQEMEEVTSRLEADSDWDGHNRYDLLKEIGDAHDPMFHGIVDEDSSCTREGRAENIATSVATAALSNVSPRSVLKRRPSHHFDSRSSYHSHVRINHLVKVFCDRNDRQGLPPNRNCILRPHFSYTDSDSARRRLSFNRKTLLYEARTWAAPQDHENINTSHYTVAWNDYEAWQELCNEQERKWTEEDTLEPVPSPTDPDDDPDQAICAERQSEDQELDGAPREGSYEEMDSASCSGDIEKGSTEKELENTSIIPPSTETCFLSDAQSSAP